MNGSRSSTLSPLIPPGSVGPLVEFVCHAASLLNVPGGGLRRFWSKLETYPFLGPSVSNPIHHRATHCQIIDGVCGRALACSKPTGASITPRRADPPYRRRLFWRLHASVLGRMSKHYRFLHDWLLTTRSRPGSTNE